MPTNLLFDFFGTLVHYTPGPFHTAPYSRTHDYLLQNGFPLSYENFTVAFETASHLLEERARLTGQEYHMHELGRLFFETAFSKKVPESIVSSFVLIFLEEWSRGIVYLDAIQPFIEELAANYRLSVLSNTNYPPLIHSHLVAMGIADHFGCIFTSVEFGVRKPSAALFHHALEQLGISPDEALYIGDNYAADYEGATAAGIRCILIDAQGNHRHIPTRVESLFDLKRHL